MNSTLNRINLINDKILTIGLLPTSYLVSMTYEEQLLWLSNYLENTLLPKLNELITTFNNDTETIEEAINNLTDLANDLREEMQELSDSVDNKLEAFMTELSENLTTIANTIITEKINNGELVVSLGSTYNEETEELTLFVNSETSSALIESLSELTTPSNEVGE